ncbi:L-amino acid N-acyltransferase YncA [Mumia flava]|uniref:L-amino acid N-acyltransferase YncA n=1 Tax=Mumia flava TaxID=1348852 RepID=A0A2M9BCZ7_9ACTN|nr:GNAT family N-acetyltransferase [Mumia flava]PJJ55823.1 L-amino acid N-acyltransferase YncA [Mumia flava]
MLYRVRTTFRDRPGVLAALATVCGDAGINILSFQAFPAHDGVTDELVVSVGAGWTEIGVAQLVTEAGGRQVSVTRCSARSLRDAPTSYLRAAADVLGGRSSLHAALERLLETEAPDVADYAGHDTIELTGTEPLAVSRAVPFTATERARASALADLVAAVGPAPDPPVPAAPRPPAQDPVVRDATAEDADDLAALHTRCSERTLFLRYNAPMTGVIHPRMARRLVAPADGVAVIATTARTVTGHAVAIPTDEDDPTRWELGILVEDVWQRRGLGTALLRHVTWAARRAGAAEVEIVTEPGNDAILRTIGRAGLLARITREGTALRISVALSPDAVPRCASPVR